jgi:hypothetical protein
MWRWKWHRVPGRPSKSGPGTRLSIPFALVSIEAAVDRDTRTGRRRKIPVPAGWELKPCGAIGRIDPTVHGGAMREQTALMAALRRRRARVP